MYLVDFWNGTPIPVMKYVGLHLLKSTFVGKVNIVQLYTVANTHILLAGNESIIRITG